MGNLLNAIAVILIIAWLIAVILIIPSLIGFVGFHIGGGLIHILMVIAIITFLLLVIQGKKSF